MRGTTGFALAVSAVLLFAVSARALGPADSHPADDPLTDAIRHLYQQELGRSPDKEGLVAYRRFMMEHDKDAAWLRHTLRHSPEGRSRRAQRRRSRRVLATVSACWLTLFVLLAAIGNLTAAAASALAQTTRRRLDIFQCFWLGFGTLLIGLQFWSLAGPINIGTQVGVVLLGSVALAWSIVRRQAKPVGFRGRPALKWVLPVFLLIAGLIVLRAIMGTASPGFAAYDTALYHWNAVRWIKTFPAVPGLANLHIRLGTNSAWLLFAALLDHGRLDGRAAWILPGFPIAVVAVQLVHAAWLSARSGLRVRVFALLTLPFLIKHLLTVRPGLYFDLPALLLLVVFALEVLRRTEAGSDGSDSEARGHPESGLVALMPVALAFVIKPVGALFLGFAAILAVVAAFRRSGPWPYWKARFSVGGLPLLLLAGWMARNAVLSGWLLFPAPGGRLPVDWSVPAEPLGAGHAAQLQSVQGQRHIIRGWARAPGPVHQEMASAPFREWWPQWYARHRRNTEIRWLLPISLCLTLLGLLKLASGALATGGGMAGALMVLCMAQVAFWLVMAPDPRFGDGLIWIWFGTAGSLVLAGARSQNGRRCTMAAAVLAFGVLTVPYASMSRLKGHGLHTFETGRARAYPTRAVELRNGQLPPLLVHVPVSGDQVGDAPLPATPYPDHRLHARRPGLLRHGFRMVDETP